MDDIVLDKEKKFVTMKYMMEVGAKELIKDNKDFVDAKIDDQIPFFKDFRVIIADKDPRDIFVAIASHKDWSYLDVFRDVDNFIKLFKLNRQYQKHNLELLGSNAKLIYCEDFINNYDKIANEIICFANLNKNDHIEKLKYFNPEISRKYVEAYKKFDNQNAIRKIEKELSEYIR